MIAARRFLQLPAEQRRLVIEASRCLLMARWRTATTPFNRIAATLNAPPKSPGARTSGTVQTDINDIGRAISQASRHLPLKLLCLQQALAAKQMLDRRNIASTLYLGTRRDQQGRLQAHAWLRSGGIEVTGGDGDRLHTVLSRYP